MIDSPPDRLCLDPASPFYDEAALARGVGEYCITENWIRAPAGKTHDRKGGLLLIKMTGKIEAYFLTPPPADPLLTETDSRRA